MDSRCFKNTLVTFKDMNSGHVASNELFSMFEKELSTILVDIKADIWRNKESWGGSVYVGLCGLALLWLHCSEANYTRLESQVTLLEKVKELCFEALQRLSDNRITFLEGKSGAIAILSVALQRLQDHENAIKAIKELISIYERKVKLMPLQECELLYGRSGFLYSLLFTREVWINSTIEDCILGIISMLIKEILNKGIQDKLSVASTKASSQKQFELPLFYSWHGKVYLGAAHGHAGILFTLLQSLKLLKDHPFHSNKEIEINLEECFSYIVNCTAKVLQFYTFPSANVASSAESKDDRLIHWCHGAPGWIPVMLELSNMLKNGDFSHLLEAKQFEYVALKMGELVWEKGILKKGLGICHGISGNAMCFISLYNHTKDLKWLHCAQQFAIFGINKKSKLIPIPDRPFSLFEGLGGLAILLHQLMNTDRAYFIGYEIPP